MSYKFIDHTADIAIEVKGKTLEELFTSSAMAWRESVTDAELLDSNQEKKLTLCSELLEILLVDFLNELNYYLQVKKWMMNSIERIGIYSTGKEWSLEAVINGSEFSPQIHSLKVEIKAITFHQMKIENINGEFATRIIFDI
ncbi:MAG: archease [Ignavibacteriales bacterium]|nr:archease [Ignavibacteriales bacterium]